MNLTPTQAAWAVEAVACPTCGVPAGDTCRTRGGDTAYRYHTARLVLVPELGNVAEVAVPDDRGPGRPWTTRQTAEPTGRRPSPAVRIGYSCVSLTDPESDNERDALRAAGCERIFTERISVRVRTRPELSAALSVAREARQRDVDRPVILTAPELGRLAREAAELSSLAATLRADGVGLELLRGPLAGVHAPEDTGTALFAVLTAVARLDRDHARDLILEGQRAAASRGRRGGRPRALDAGMLALARELREQGMPVPDIAARLTVTTGRNAGGHPSIASVYRALAVSDAVDASAPRHEPTETDELVTTEGKR